MKQNVKILFEDSDVVIVDKQHGMLSIPDRYAKDAPNLRGMLEAKYGEIFVVHRLDRDTSGVMVFAKNAAAHKNLSLQFEQHTITKKYVAVVQGKVERDEIPIDIPLMQDPNTPGKMMPSSRGKESLTILRVLERYRIATLVECELHTGRQHQLRVHCAVIGHPLLIDSLYGKATEFKLSTIKRRYNLAKDEEEKPIITRATLHAHKLGFLHPSTSEAVVFESEIPKDLKALISVLGKYSALKSTVITR